MNKVLLLVVYFFTFLTGAAGLIYEVTWQKYLSRILGSDTVATAIILATFLGGLSVGYYVCGKLTTRVQNHFKGYALLEGVIAIWGFLFPVIFGLVDSATRGWSFSPPLLILVQGLFCSALLIGIPTVCMGGTIPFLTRGISQSVEEATRVHAKVYGVNTAGAFLGTLAAGFLMIPSLGLPLTTMYTALLNFSAALFFFLASMKLTSRQDALSQASGDGEQVMFPVASPPFRHPPLILYTVAFMSGFYVMTLENVLIRLINLSMGSSSYSFSMIVSVFVLAIAIGSYAVGRLRELPRHLLFFNQFLIALLILLLYFSIDTWPYWAHLLRISMQSNMAGFWAYYANVFLALTLVLILPVSLMGATVPITFHEIKRDLANVGRHSGLLFSLNTIGNLTGSLVGGIVLFYAFDLPGVFSLAVFFAALSACLVAWKISKKYFMLSATMAAVAALFAVATPFYETKHFMVGTFRFRSPQPYSMSGPREFFAGLTRGSSLYFHKDGPEASVAVMERPETKLLDGIKPISIIINGKSDSSTVGDIYTLKLSAHLPALLSSQRRRVMVIGLGTGVTAGELTLYPEIEKIDVAEISETVVEALPYFSNANYNVHKNPKVNIHIGDAFRILGRSKSKWDIIISEPSNPWVTGVDLLFTREFYALAKERLSANGILLQWVQIYDADIHMVGMIVNTVMKEFRRCHVFLSNPGDLLIVATDKEFTREDLQKAENLLEANKAVRASLETIRLSSLDTILLRELWSPSYNRDFFSHSGIQTMDHPKLHYVAGKTFFTGATMSKEALLNPGSVPLLPEYLLVKRHPEWGKFALNAENFKSFLESTKERVGGTDLPMATAVRLKAYLYDSTKFPLTKEEKQFLKTDLLPLITGKTRDEEAWAKAGLKGASYRTKATTSLSYFIQHRNWIVPFSIDGLRALLEEGITRGDEDSEKNFFVIQLTHLLVNERATIDQIRATLDRLKRDKEGRVLLKEEDEGLWRSLEMRLNNLSTS
jgi:predicted membrane-bound spermidine synthase